MFTRRYLLGNLLLAMLAVGPTASLGSDADEAIEFNRDIRPILSDACFHCHGPDKAQRQADLRLDLEEAALADLGGHRALAPGDLKASALYQRVISTDPDERMPPPDSGRKLSAQQIDLLRRWIEQGAKWQPHWSLITPQRPELPAVKQSGWVRTPIDTFILERLEREKLTPSPEAEKTTLLRRVTLDLTGLPPTLAELDAFLADPSPQAYERAVDRLLASPHYGERMATRWLDGARYADTSGYQSDGERVMWRWRDWVIDAFNANMPFDQFTVEQLAGDLLPNATVEQKIATGFNRNHRGNAEGGIIPEEYAVEYVVDRVETTSTVWLGLTLGCTRCHDHKYDPFSQREFYQLYSFFNRVPEKGRAIKYGNSPPYIKSPTDDQQRALDALEAQLATAKARFTGMEKEIASAQAAWEASPASAELQDWTPQHDLVAHFGLNGDARNDAANDAPPTLSDAFKDGDYEFCRGRIAQAAEFDGQRYLEAGNLAPFGFYDKFTLAAWVKVDGASGTIIAKVKEGSRSNGYSLVLDEGKVQLNLVVRWLDDALRVESAGSVPSGEWHHVAASYDGSRLASGVQLYIDGQPQQIKVNLDELNQSFATKEPFRIGAGTADAVRFKGAIDDVRVYSAVLTTDEVATLATSASIAEILKTPPARRTAGAQAKLRIAFLEREAPEPLRKVRKQMVELAAECIRLSDEFPTTMIMEDVPQPRETFILLRGEYDKHGEQVASGVPKSLTPFPSGEPDNRLGLAHWLVEPAHPLTARVAVNRFWQMYFGNGLVKTVDDFGSQGEWPSHPELLDWLATEFISSGWNVKAMHKLIVTSAAYRQSSKVTPVLLQKDPENRLLARGPRLRLSAEMIRDQALAVAGLLVGKVGGPSVKPYQPDGLYKELTDVEYKPDSGAALYRRSMYTYWKRTIAPPSMMTFDAAGREMCMVRETRTNTPLQALTLMNDVTFVEASRRLAQRVMHEAGASPEDRLTYAFRLVTSRQPRSAELEILVRNFARQLSRFRKQPAAATDLLKIGESPCDEKLSAAELAAYTAVAGLVLNLDETVTKE